MRLFVASISLNFYAKQKWYNVTNGTTGIQNRLRPEIVTNSELFSKLVFECLAHDVDRRILVDKIVPGTGIGPTVVKSSHIHA